MPLPKSRNKLIKLFNQINDESLRIIISEIVDIEHENRSSLKFPIRKIEDIVDAEANRLEMSTRRGKDEI